MLLKHYCFILICVFTSNLERCDAYREVIDIDGEEMEWVKFGTTEYSIIYKVLVDSAVAYKHCTNNNALLIMPKSAEERAFMKELYDKKNFTEPPYHVHIGLYKGSSALLEYTWYDRTGMVNGKDHFAPDANLDPPSGSSVPIEGYAGRRLVKEPELYWRFSDIADIETKARTICQRPFAIPPTEPSTTVEDTTTPIPVDIQADFELGENEIQEMITDRSPTLMYIVSGGILLVVVFLMVAYWWKRRDALLHPDEALKHGDIFYTIDDLRDQKQKSMRFSIFSSTAFYRHAIPEAISTRPALELAPPSVPTEIPHEEESDPKIFPNSFFQSSVESFPEYADDEHHEEHGYH